MDRACDGVGQTRCRRNNLTSELKALGLSQVNSIHTLEDINGALGGPIVRDRLWFFTTARLQQD